MKSHIILTLTFLFLTNIVLYSQSLIKDIRPGPWGSVVSPPLPFNDKVYFTGISGLTGNDGEDFWTSDGSTEGTYMIKEIAQFTWEVGPSWYMIFNGNIYFSGKDTITSVPKLWKSDGTEEGTNIMHSVPPSSMMALDTIFLFNGDQGELWRSNGTSSGTYLLKDINPNGASIPNLRLRVGNNIYFFANDGTHGTELWKTDGTEDGTIMIKDINSGSNSSHPMIFSQHNDIILFSANDGIHGRELWRTDGTTEGTVMIKDIYPGPTDQFINVIGSFDSLTLFTASDLIHGNEIWKTDGTEDGTMMLKDINPENGSSDVFHFTSIRFDSLLYFGANDGVHGSELWVSDLTSNGTHLIKDINPGPNSSFNFWSSFKKINGEIYFGVDDGIHGTELWRTNGTSESTFLLQDINPGPSSSNPVYLTTLNNFLFFRANDGQSGDELWKIEFSPLEVELLSFKAERIKNKEISITWTTSFETSNLGFELEKSSDSKKWININFTQSLNEHSTTKSHYSFVDSNPYIGSNYYRLKQIDLDGSSEYSQVVEINNSENNFLIFPNPTSEILNIRFDNNNSSNIHDIKIMSNTGRIFFERTKVELPISLDISNYPKGGYIVLISDKFSNILYNKFIKK